MVGGTGNITAAPSSLNIVRKRAAWKMSSGDTAQVGQNMALPYIPL